MVWYKVFCCVNEALPTLFTVGAIVFNKCLCYNEICWEIHYNIALQ